MGNTVDRLYDVGVAGLHRLLGEHERLRRARVLIVVAGMEGALPSVIGGLVNVPVIAVPTSVGYGASYRRDRGAAGDAQLVRQRRGGGEHRQRIRRRLSGVSNQPPLTTSNAQKPNPVGILVSWS